MDGDNDADSASEKALAERVQWLVDNRAGGSQRELARMAGLKSGSHIGTIVGRGGGRSSGKALAQIARGAGVNLVWLIEGIGPRDIGSDASESAFPALSNVVGWKEAEAKAREIGRFPLAIYEHLREARGLVPPDPVTPEWIASQAMDVWRNLDMEARAAAEEHETERLAKLIRNRWGNRKPKSAESSAKKPETTSLKKPGAKAK